MSETRIFLVTIKGEQGVRTHLIAKESFNLGRAQEADLPFLSPSVSRLHLKVDFKDGGVFVTDPNSANGTLVNGQMIDRGVTRQIGPQDVVKLGTSNEEFTFQSIPQPFELANPDKQRESMLGSMGDFIAEMERKVETQLRGESENRMRLAKIEAERTLLAARTEADTLRSRDQIEIQKQRQSLEAEIMRQEQEAKILLAQEKLNASREADQIISEAQKRIQKDYDESSRQIEARLKEVSQQSGGLIEQAQTKSEEILSQAQAESNRLRREASEEARTLVQDALRKRDESFASLKSDFQSEVAAKKDELYAQVQREAKAERERLEEELKLATQNLRNEVAALEQSKKELSPELDRIKKAQAQSVNDTRELESRAESARTLLSRVEELEKRQENAARELEKFNRTRDEGLAKLENEMKQTREKNILEFDDRKRQQEQDISRDRVKAFETLRKEIEQREKDYESRKRLRAIEVSQKLQERMLTQLPTWMKDPSHAPVDLKVGIDAVVMETLVDEKSTIQPGTKTAEASKEAVQEKRDRKILKIGGIAAAVLIVVGFVYRGEVMSSLKARDKDNYATKILADRHEKSIYHPEQGEVFKGTYTDNVLFMKDYYETKTNPDYIEKWTLKLNDLHYLNSVGLSEENIVQFVAKETNLIQRLGVMRSGIDAVYLNEGIDRMRSAEDEAMKEMVATLGTQDKFKEIRKQEEKFLREFMKH